MTSEADRFWNDIAPKYRAIRGLCPVTPEEADAEYDNTPKIPLSESEIQAMVDAATSGQPPPGGTGPPGHDPAAGRSLTHR
jgi:hypothetical protein